MQNRRGSFGLCLLLSAVPVMAQGRLIVVSQKDHALHVIDPASRKEVKLVEEDGVTGHEVTTSADGKTAYVPIYGNAGVGKPGTNGDHIDIIDLPSGKVTGTISFGHGVRPHAAHWDPKTGQLLVSTELDKSISIIDVKSNKIVGSIPTGQEQSHMFVVSPDGTRAYSANVSAGTVSVMDVPNRKLLKVITISTNTQRINITADGKTVFTANQAKPELVAIDTATNEVKKRIPLPSVGYGTGETLDHKYLLVASDLETKIAVVDLKTLEVVKTIDAPKVTYEFVMNPNGREAYVSCPGTNTVAIIDLKDWKITGEMKVGTFPDGMTWAK